MGYERVSGSLRVYGLTPTEHYVLAWLADFENSTSGKCNPSIETLVAVTGMSESALHRTIRKLESKKVITKEVSFSIGKRQSSNSYSFNFPTVTRGVGSDTPGVPLLIPQGCQNRHPRGTKSDTQTNNIEQVNKNKEENKVSITTTTPTPPTKSPTPSKASICGGGGPSRLDTSTFVCTNPNPCSYPENFKQVSEYLDANWTGAVDSDALFATFMRLKTNHWCDGNGKPIRDWREYFSALNRIHIAKTIP